MMKICNNKKYRTRSGRRVIIDRKRTACSVYAVTGWIVTNDGKRHRESWASDGKYLRGECINPWDLVEVEE